MTSPVDAERWRLQAHSAELRAAALEDQLERLRQQNQTLRAAVPDDIRAQGWTLAVHNDYRQAGVQHTFWLFTKDGRAVKGEGRTDADALTEVRRQIGEQN